MIVALAGRRIDAPSADTPRFPSANEEMVRDRLRAMFVEKQVQVLVCSAACGADLLALEVARDLGVRQRVVVPYAPARFRETSVVDRPGDWGARFDAIIEVVEANGDLVVLGYAEGEETAYVPTNEAILEQATLLASQLQQSVEAVVVWEGAARGEDDVTAAFVQAAQRRGIPVSYVVTL